MKRRVCVYLSTMTQHRERRAAEREVINFNIELIWLLMEECSVDNIMRATLIFHANTIYPSKHNAPYKPVAVDLLYRLRCGYVGAVFG